MVKKFWWLVKMGDSMKFLPLKKKIVTIHKLFSKNLIQEHLL